MLFKKLCFFKFGPIYFLKCCLFSVMSMVTKDTIKLALIFACIALHCIDGVGVFYSNAFDEKTLALSQSSSNFLALRDYIPFLARIAGGYCLGKLADKIGFFKTMEIICLVPVITGCAILFFESPAIFENTILRSIGYWILKFIRWSSLILPLIYIFQHTEKSKHWKYSAIAFSTFVLGMLINNRLFIVYKSADSFNLFLINILCGLLSLIIYFYLNTMPKIKLENIKKNQILKQARSFAFLLAGTVGACLSYQFYFVEQYFSTVMIIETAGQYIAYSPFWITLFLTILPLAKITRTLDLAKILKISLTGIILSAVLLHITPLYNEHILFIHQIMYALSFGLFLGPALRFIYQLLQINHSYFLTNFIFGFGFSFFSMASSLIAKTKFLPAPLLGLVLIIAVMSLCLWMLSYFKFSKENEEYKC